MFRPDFDGSEFGASGVLNCPPKPFVFCGLAAVGQVIGLSRGVLVVPNPFLDVSVGAISDV
jgi:hypothetical protein